MPTDRVHCPPRQAQLRTVPPDTPKRQHQTQPHILEIPARLRTRGATPVPSRYTRSVALHPFRRAAPVPLRYTRSEGVSCLRIGCTAAHDKYNCGQFLPTHPSGSIRRSHTTSKYPPGSEQDALHPIRRATPVPSRYTRSEGVSRLRIGCTAPHHKHN